MSKAVQKGQEDSLEEHSTHLRKLAEDSVKQRAASVLAKFEDILKTSNETLSQKEKNCSTKCNKLQKQSKMKSCEWSGLTEGKIMKPQNRKIVQAAKENSFVGEVLEGSTSNESNVQLNVQENPSKNKSILSSATGCENQRKTRRAEHLSLLQPNYRLINRSVNILSKWTHQKRTNVKKINICDWQCNLVTQTGGAFDKTYSKRSSKDKVLFPKEYKNKITRSCASKTIARIRLKENGRGGKCYSSQLPATPSWCEGEHNTNLKYIREKAPIIQFELLLPDQSSSPVEIDQIQHSEDNVENSISAKHKDSNLRAVPYNKHSEPVDRPPQLEEHTNIDKINPAVNINNGVLIVKKGSGDNSTDMKKVISNTKMKKNSSEGEKCNS